VAGAEVRMGDRAWVTTSGDGSFDFRIAPGDHTFDVYDGGKKEASFTATVTAGDTADAGTVKFEAEDEGGDLTLYMVIAIVVVIVVVAALLVARSRKGEG
jgi:hypothetical protein